MADRYEIKITDDAFRHLEGFVASARTAITDEIETQLAFEPTRETKKRKRLRPSNLATFRLRVQDYRIYYDVSDEPRTVTIVAIGLKKGAQVFIDGEEFPV